MNLGLDGKVALVSGGAKGIGAAAVKLLLAEGASVVVADFDGEAGAALVAGSPAERLIFHQGDLADEAVCLEAVTESVRTFERLDILINNAGVNDAVGLDQTPDKFLASLQRNLVPAYSLTHYALPHLRKTKGSIVNLGSKVAITGQGATSGYAAAKGGINALTREWAAALATDGIRVNAVLPAECDTDQYRRWFASVPDPAGTRKAIENLVPLGHRLTTPEELAAMVVFLASPVSSHTTGQIIFVDGGYTHLDRALTATHRKWS
jgi:NAD(P)-dependent dehydrogenase (short-subunit alcohol dehydrogenase family)